MHAQLGVLMLVPQTILRNAEGRKANGRARCDGVISAASSEGRRTPRGGGPPQRYGTRRPRSARLPNGMSCTPSYQERFLKIESLSVCSKLRKPRPDWPEHPARDAHIVGHYAPAFARNDRDGADLRASGRGKAKAALQKKSTKGSAAKGSTKAGALMTPARIAPLLFYSCSPCKRGTSISLALWAASKLFSSTALKNSMSSWSPSDWASWM